MAKGLIAPRTFMASGPKSRALNRERFMLDLIYLVSGCAIFVAFGLYALALKRV
jgi:hypothetical protein